MAVSHWLPPEELGLIEGESEHATGDFRPDFWLLSLLAASSVLAVLVFHRPDRDRQHCQAQGA